MNNETTTPAWGKPIPFETVNVPDFPIESLPGPIFAYVEALAEFTQAPVEMAAEKWRVSDGQ